MRFSTVASTLSVALPLVNAHGYISSALINSVNYTLYNPNIDPYLSPSVDRINRKIPGNGPVTDLSLIDVQCNGYTDGDFYTEPAPISAPVTAGSKVSLLWTQWPDSHLGPLITYMAKCPGDCADYMPGTDKVWFKVAEAGKDSSGTWADEPLMTNPPATYSFTIPSALASGNYIIRHEIIALHAAYEYPGAQVYPSCIQVEVSGSGSKTPTDLVAFPGAYTADTPGIVYDVYTNTSAYPIPGPAVWTG